MPGLPARLPAPATVAHQIAGYWSGDHRSRRGDEDEQHCYSHSWRIALLERFWQARHPPRYAAYLTPSSPRFRLSSFDNWFDPIETEVRARARGFIEELLRGELDEALARPRYGRGQMAGNEGRSGIAGHRHGSRTRSLTGTFGPIEIAVPRARMARRCCSQSRAWAARAPRPGARCWTI